MLRPWYRSEWLRIGGLLLVLAAAVVPVLVRVTPSFTVSGLNVRIQHIQPDEPNWTKGLELVADLQDVHATPAFAKPTQGRG